MAALTAAESSVSWKPAVRFPLAFFGDTIFLYVLSTSWSSPCTPVAPDAGVAAHNDGGHNRVTDSETSRR